MKKISVAIPLSIFLLFAPTSVQAASAVTTEEIKVVKLDSIKDVSIDHPQDTVVFFDLDDTVFDSPYMLGSRAWRRYIIEATKHLDRNWHDILTLFVTQKLQFVTVEPEMLPTIQSLKSKGCMTTGLTARERQMWYSTPMPDIDKLTISQLKSVNVDFDNNLFKEKHPGLAGDSEYYEGVFFANTDLKGDYLRRIMKDSSNRPIKVVFIDDKLSQVESVAKTLNEFQIPYECYWYRATDGKAAKFNPLIANIQLYYFWLSDGKIVLTDELAYTIAKNDPEKDANFYLQAVLNLNEIN